MNSSSRSPLSAAFWIAAAFAAGAGVTATFFIYSRTPSESVGWRVRSEISGRSSVSLGQKPQSESRLVYDKHAQATARNERAKGNYILDLDMPLLKARLEDRDRRLIAHIMESRGPLYERLFSGYGIDEAVREQLLHHISLIYQAKIDSRKTSTQLLNAQTVYENRMKGILGDKYLEYKRYEAGERSRQESKRITDFAKASGVFDISSPRWVELQDIIQKNGAYSAETLGDVSGPFDELNKPLQGAASVLPFIEQSQATLAINSASVVEQARARGFSPAEIQLLEKYYATEIAYYDWAVEAVHNPSRARIIMLENRLTALRSDPDASAAELRRLEDQIGRLRSGEDSSVPAQ